MSKNLNPDTVTIYSFANKEFPVDAFPNSKPLSNYGFKLKKFKITCNWFTVKNANDTGFIRRSIYSDRKAKVVDTIAMSIFGQPFNGFVVEKRGDYLFALFPVNSGLQNIFILTPKSKRQLNECIRYIRTNF